MDVVGIHFPTDPSLRLLNLRLIPLQWAVADGLRLMAVFDCSPAIFS